MKKLLLVVVSLLIVILSIIAIYFNSDNYIKNQEWKYADGAHIGDWLNKTSLTIKDGMIYTSGGKAKILFCYGKGLIIKNSDTGQNGTYINKS
jgi:hypothetical protein